MSECQRESVRREYHLKASIATTLLLMMIRNSLIPRAISLALILKTTLANDNSTASAALAGAPANFSVDRSVSTASSIK